MTRPTDPAAKTWAFTHGVKIGKHSPCPSRWLFNKRCRGLGCCWHDDRMCALDHVYAITRISDGVRGLLSMPYGLSDYNANQLTMWCGEKGLSWTAIGDGWHFPGTVAIVVFPKERR